MLVMVRMRRRRRSVEFHPNVTPFVVSLGSSNAKDLWENNIEFAKPKQMEGRNPTKYLR